MTRVLFLLLLAGCPGADTDTDGDTDTNTDTDTELDSDSETDSDTEMDSDTEADTDDDTSDPDRVTAIMGERCAPHDQIAEVSLRLQGENVNANGVVWDGPPAVPETPTLSSDGCSYYTFDPNSCGTCESGDVCMPDGECTPRRASLETSSMVITVNGIDTPIANSGGWLYGSNIGTASDTFDVDLMWEDTVVSLTNVTLPSGVTGLHAEASGGWDGPGILSMTWDVGTGDAEVFTDIPMNHHVRIPAFTRCRAAVSAGSMTASAAMIDPLAQVTGLEFQGFYVERTAAAQTAEGCVQFNVGEQSYTSVEYPNASF